MSDCGSCAACQQGSGNMFSEISASVSPRDTEPCQQAWVGRCFMMRLDPGGFHRSQRRAAHLVGSTWVPRLWQQVAAVHSLARNGIPCASPCRINAERYVSSTGTHLNTFTAHSPCRGPTFSFSSTMTQSITILKTSKAENPLRCEHCSSSYLRLDASYIPFSTACLQQGGMVVRTCPTTSAMLIPVPPRSKRIPTSS